jgi:tripeptide aminopeptidase
MMQFQIGRTSSRRLRLRTTIAIDEHAAIDRLLRFLRIEGVTGQEKEIAQAVAAELVELGLPRRNIAFDDANKRIPLPTQTGNLIARVPGTMDGPEMMFACHLDTVPLCAGAVPVHRGKRIVAGGKTALGGDNRTGVACLVTLVATLKKQRLPHPPLVLLFTVREESGLWGARHVNGDLLGRPVLGFNVDGRRTADLIIGAVGAERWQAEIHGRAAHAGVYPERGISASLVASLALARVYEGGWFGKIRRGRREGTSNVGSIGGANGHSAGIATNVVTDYTLVHGESRSHDPHFVKSITAAYREAFRGAGKELTNEAGRRARIRFSTRLDYHAFRLKPSAPVVRHAVRAAESLGMKPRLRATNGGLDANWFVRHGIPTVTIGAGQNNIHSVGEFVDVPDFLSSCRLLVAVAARAGSQTP